MNRVRNRRQPGRAGRFLPFILVLSLLLSMIPGPALAQANLSGQRLHPLLREIAQEEGSGSVRVIVQTTGPLDEMAAGITWLGGVAVRNLEIINAVVADVPVDRLNDLARLPGVRAISPDAPVVKTANFGDEVIVLQQDFNAGASGMDSSVNWNGVGSSVNWNWVEFGEEDGFEAGDIAITPFLGGTAEGVRLQSGGKGVQAGVDLTQAAGATLSMTFRRKNFETAQDAVLIQASADGGLQWQEIARQTGPGSDPALLTVHYDLSSFQGSELILRLLVAESTDPAARFYLDFVQLQYQLDPQLSRYQVSIPHLSAADAAQSNAEPEFFSANSTYTVRDEFNSVSYGNNDGTQQWSGGWVESGDNVSASGGDITVEVDECPDAASRCIEFDGDADLNSSVSREVNLSVAGAATLTFDYHLDEKDALYVLEVSADGGVTWHTLKSYSTPAVVTGETFDLSAYLSAATRIRFRLADRDDDAHFSIDNVQIEWTAGGSSPTLPPESALTVRDEFNQISYGNNDGSVQWSSGWIETDDDGSPSGGDITVEKDECPDEDSQCIEFDGDADEDSAIERQANLGTGNSAILSFDYHLDMSGAVYALEASGDGGATWHTLKSYSLPAIVIGEQIDLSAYASPTTRIRFRLVEDENDAHLSIDNVQIQWGSGDAIDTSRLASTYVKSISADHLWNRSSKYLRGNNVTVAVVDSGIARHLDLDDDEDDDNDGDGKYRSRILAHVDFTTGGYIDDFYGHGTHVAGIIAGNGKKSDDAYMGVAPRADLVDVKVTDDYGVGSTSDVVAGLGWVLENKDTYNIRVVNMSLNSTVAESYHDSPLDAAVEILWFNGIVVVVSGGNNGSTNAGVIYPPANDPFIITVGAVDDRGTRTISDDVLASYTAYGLTTDGFVKPDIVVPGSNIIASLSGDDSNLALDHPAHAVYGASGAYYFRMSGTSMASAVVAGAVALLLEDEPNLTPDQVKYRLMATASYPIEMPLGTVTASAVSTAQTYRDDFSGSRIYNNSSGTKDWSSFAWTEIAEPSGAGPADGPVQVSPNSTNCASPNCLRVGGSKPNNPDPGFGVYRQLDLTGATSAALSYSYRRGTFGSCQAPYATLTLDLSGNGGASWSTVKTYTLNGVDSVRTAESFDITPFIGPDTRIRFLTHGPNNDCVFFADDIQVAFDSAPAPAPTPSVFRPAYMDIRAAVEGTSVESANQGIMPHMVLAKMAMIAYWASQNGGDAIDWSSVDWDSVNWNSVNWNSVNWNSVNWNSVNWNSVNWNSVNWNSVNWNSVNWNSVNWNSGFTWSSVNWNSGFTWSSGFTWGSVHWDD